ncbi:MAG: hypothetical protein JNL74_16240 [Fibrobacteres bacterium]|nr:hypothetical protein [Fibrobacterota bacterium]
MKNKKLLIFLTITALAIWSLNIFKVRNALASVQEPEKTDIKLSTASEQKYDYDINVRDPFEEQIKKTIVHDKKVEEKKDLDRVAFTAPPPYVIDGMLWDDKKPMAMVKNIRTGEVKGVENGTTWNDISVIKILPDAVKVRYKGKEFDIH